MQLALPDGEAAPKQRDLQVEVKPARVRVSLRGTPLLEGRLGGEVLAEEGEWEWEVGEAASATSDGEAKAQPAAARVLRLTLAKRCAAGSAAGEGCLTHPCSTVSYDPAEQWSSLLLGPGHPLIDTQRMSWTRARPWRPPQDARTRVRPAAHPLGCRQAITHSLASVYRTKLRALSLATGCWTRPSMSCQRPAQAPTSRSGVANGQRGKSLTDAVFRVTVLASQAATPAAL